MARYYDLDKLSEMIEARAEQLIEGKEALLYVAKWLNLLPTADVVPKSEEGAECPACHGTGRIGTTDWLTKNISKEQLAKEKAEAIAEHEQHIKTEVAREILDWIERSMVIYNPEIPGLRLISMHVFNTLKKKYTEGERD